MLSRLPAIMQRIEAIEAGLEGVSAPARSAREANFGAALAAASQGVANTAGGEATSSGRFEAIIRQAARANDISPDLIHAVVRAESDYNPNCRSSAGAMGLMQL
ncbi:MAG: transglycosylase SLT domain-containing protein, partial [Armatimonadota bacterium]